MNATEQRLTPQELGGSVLVVEDDADYAFALDKLLSTCGLDVSMASSLTEAQALLSARQFDGAIADLSLPDASDTDIVDAIQSEQPECPVVVLTGNNEAELAVSALRAGAQDYLVKPVRRAALLDALSQALDRGKRNQQVSNLRGRKSQVVGESSVWRQAMRMVQAAAAAPRTAVLLTGEPGVGKEVAARLIHQHGSDEGAPFITVNVACLPATLIESELFGHQPGAFTGARAVKRGVFELAHDGTLFLDEIGEMPLSLQPKLLRVLEGHSFRRLGGERSVRPSVRIISATNRPLDEMVDQGRFRPDLFHRLKVLEIPLPPLRERGDDVEKLAMHFLAQLGAEMGHPDARFGPEVLPMLLRYHWPGNIRELRNVVERSVVLSRGGQITPEHLPREVRATHLRRSGSIPRTMIERSLEGDLSLEAAKRRHILAVYQKHGGNVTHTANALDVTRQTLRRYLKSYGLSD